MSIKTIGMTEDYYRGRTMGLDCPGVCLACGAEADGCEPDACNYVCEACEEAQVFGLDEALMMGRIVFVEEAQAEYAQSFPSTPCGGWCWTDWILERF